MSFPCGSMGSWSSCSPSFLVFIDEEDGRLWIPVFTGMTAKQVFVPLCGALTSQGLSSLISGRVRCAFSTHQIICRRVVRQKARRTLQVATS